MANLFGRHWPAIKYLQQRIIGSTLCILMVLGLVSCSQQPSDGKSVDGSRAIMGRAAKVEEVSPPEVIQQLRLALDRYHPEVKILGPKPNETIESTSVTVRFQVEDFPLYKDPELALGPHLHVFLDDQSYQAVYDAKQSLTFEDLSPGTHTIRAFASRPWHESFKTTGAFDQLTFHVFASTQAYQPNPGQPLLTYSRPQGDYGAEPIMLDYLITSPSNSSNNKVTLQAGTTGTKVRVSLNGESFTTSAQMPIYLKGFRSGENWVKLELLNQSGQPVPNAFSETIRLVTLHPNGQDTLSKIVRGELTAQEAERIVDLGVSQRLAAQKPKPEPVQPSPTVQPIPIPVVPVVPSPQASVFPSVIPEIAPERQPSKLTPSIRVTPSPKVSAQPKPKTPVVRTAATPSPKPSPKSTESVAPLPALKSSPSPTTPIPSVPKPSSALNQVDEQIGKPLKGWFDQAKKGVMEQLKGDRASIQPTALPTDIPLSPPIQRLGSVPQADLKKALLSEPKQLELSQPSRIEVKKIPDAGPPSKKTIPTLPTQASKPTVNWKKFLKLPQSNKDKVTILKPTEQSVAPNRDPKSAETANLSTNEPDSSK